MILADNIVEFPLGKEFYDPVDLGDKRNLVDISVAVKDDNIVYDLSQIIHITPGWYADMNVAKMYNKPCNGNNCIFAFELKKDITFYLLDDSYNIYKLLSSNKVPQDIKRGLSKMFDLKTETPKKNKSENPFKRFEYELNRISNRVYDIPFAKWACANIIPNYNYAGMAATVQPTSHHGGKFHLEFIFCNASKYLKRNLHSKYDWQYFDNKDLEGYPENKKLFDVMKKFKTINTNFHAGNLIEHSVWILLHYELILKSPGIQKINIVDRNYAILGGIATYLHDIGKMNVKDTKHLKKTNRGNYVYFDIPDHPYFGYQMISGELPLYDVKGQEINLGKVINEISMKIVKNTVDKLGKKIISYLILEHWFYGVEVLAKLDQGFALDKVVNEYIKNRKGTFDKVVGGNNEAFMNTLIILILLSTADIAASLPPGKGRVKEGEQINISSEIVPFIKNRPQKYRGTNLYMKTQAYNKTMKVLEYIKTL